MVLYRQSGALLTGVLRAVRAHTMVAARFAQVVPAKPPDGRRLPVMDQLLQSLFVLRIRAGY